jgi:hypothetical protein
MVEKEVERLRIGDMLRLYRLVEEEHRLNRGWRVLLVLKVRGEFPGRLFDRRLIDGAG